VSGAFSHLGTLVLVTIVSLLNPSQALLRYLMGFINIEVFTLKDGYRHRTTDACDQIAAAPKMDTVLGVVTTIVAHQLLMPVAFTLASVLVPGCKGMVTDMWGGSSTGKGTAANQSKVSSSTSGTSSSSSKKGYSKRSAVIVPEE
jgi:hypothetical protein